MYFEVCRSRGVYSANFTEKIPAKNTVAIINMFLEKPRILNFRQELLIVKTTDQKQCSFPSSTFRLQVDKLNCLKSKYQTMVTNQLSYNNTITIF